MWPSFYFTAKGRELGSLGFWIFFVTLAFGFWNVAFSGEFCMSKLVIIFMVSAEEYRLLAKPVNHSVSVGCYFCILFLVVCSIYFLVNLLLVISICLGRLLRNADGHCRLE